MYRLVKDNLWVLLFLLVLTTFYVKEIKEKQTRMLYLEEEKKRWESEKILATEKQKELELRLNSQEDPASIELILREKLGVARRFERKVYFLSSSTSWNQPRCDG